MADREGPSADDLALHPSPSYAEGRLADARDAERWRALLGSARLHFMGSAGFDYPHKDGESLIKHAVVLPQFCYLCGGSGEGVGGLRNDISGMIVAEILERIRNTAQPRRQRRQLVSVSGHVGAPGTGRGRGWCRRKPISGSSRWTSMRRTKSSKPPKPASASWRRRCGRSPTSRIGMRRLTTPPGGMTTSRSNARRSATSAAPVLSSRESGDERTNANTAQGSS